MRRCCIWCLGIGPGARGRGTWRDGSTSCRGSSRRRRDATRGRTPGRWRGRDGRSGRRREGGGGVMGAPVVHFEIYGKDASKLQSFYADLFGWEIHADNPLNYGIVHTNAGDKGIGGGITEGDARVNVVVDVDDLQKYLDKAVSMGGEVVTPITEIPDMVTWAEFRDPAGNVIGISLAESCCGTPPHVGDGGSD